jgi:hypothetical protein
VAEEEANAGDSADGADELTLPAAFGVPFAVWGYVFHPTRRTRGAQRLDLLAFRFADPRPTWA